MDENGVKKYPWHWLLKAVAVVLTMSLLWSIISPSIVALLSISAEAALKAEADAEADRAAHFAEYNQLADIAIGEENYVQAAEYLEQARSFSAGESQSTRAELFLKSASVSILTGQTEQAQLLLEEALKLDGNSTQALLLSAQLAIDRGSNPEAIDYLVKYAQLTPGDIETGLALASLQEASGDYAGAKGQYEALYAQQPEDLSHWLNAARCQFLAGEQTGAMEEFTRFLAENPDSEYYPVALFLRSASLMQAGRFEEAAEGFAQAQQHGYDAASCYEQLMLCSFETNDYQQAVAYGEKWMEQNGALNSPELFYQRMGASLVLLERYEEAADYLDQAVQYAPQLGGNAYYYGVALLALERYEEAVTQFTASIEQGFLTQFCYYNRGVCYVQLLDYDKAYEDMRMTLTSGADPSLTEAATDIISQLDAYRQTEPAV